MDSTITTESLRLMPVSGPALSPITIEPTQQPLLGRSMECAVELPDAAVSRRHATIQARRGRWLITDLGSRHGTFLNTTRLESGKATSLENEDTLRIGPWLLRVLIGDRPVLVTNTTEMPESGRERVERVAADELSRLAQHRLNLLLDSAAQIHGAANEQELSQQLLRTAIDGTGFARAALLRPVGSDENVEVIAWQRRDGRDARDASDASFSRSLVRAAARGETVRMSSDAETTPAMGQSIVSLRITEALCTPIMNGDVVQAFLYLDAREQESPIAPDAASFCQAIARLGALAFSSLKRIDLQRRTTQLETELGAARQAQRLIMPATRGKVGPLQYALENRPGRFVAGDLFEVLELSGGRIAVCLGDVAGEGIGAAVLMVAAQSHLNAALARHGDAVAAIQQVNSYICARSSSGSFVSLWVGIFHPDGLVEFVDAGHGHWLLHSAHTDDAPSDVAGQPNARFVKHAGGIPIGIEPGFPYPLDKLRLQPGERVILYSDGISEQTSPTGEQFGTQRIIDVLRQCVDEHQDVQRVIAAVEDFAEQAQFADDTTIGSVRYLGEA